MMFGLSNVIKSDQGREFNNKFDENAQLKTTVMNSISPTSAMCACWTFILFMYFEKYKCR